MVPGSDALVAPAFGRTGLTPGSMIKTVDFSQTPHTSWPEHGVIRSGSARLRQNGSDPMTPLFLIFRDARRSAFPRPSRTKHIHATFSIGNAVPGGLLMRHFSSVLSAALAIAAGLLATASLALDAGNWMDAAALSRRFATEQGSKALAAGFRCSLLSLC